MRKKVLMLDNDPEILEVMKFALTYEEYEVVTVNKTECMFLVLKDFNPDIILIDYLLDGINGGDVCNLLKSSEQYSHIPIIMLSAYYRVIEMLGNYNCDIFISKPFDLSKLLQTITGLIDNPFNEYNNMAG
ncbi:response regulator transcription factor [Mucilaginibacter limnophilus]|nr:response regulator [Mucilaginibacter limnophilus]